MEMFSWLLSALLTPAWAANNAQFIEQSVSTAMVAGWAYPVSIKMKNTGDTTWTKALLYRLGTQNPQDNQIWLPSSGRIELANADSIAPGQTKDFKFTVYAPTMAAVSNFQWRMLREGVEWFGDQTINIAVVVSPDFSADHTSYQAGETPAFKLTGAAANSAILWSSWKNGVQVETDADLGQTTDGQGRWSGTRTAWTSSDVGFWIREVKTGTLKARYSFAVVLSLTAVASSTATRTLSASHVAGDYRLTSEPFLLEGAKFVRNLSPGSIFVYLTPQYSSRDYPATDFGAGPIASLKTLAQTAPYQQLFGMGFSTFVITAYSFASDSWINAVPRGPFTNAAAEQNEFYQLAKHLLETYQNTSRTFILKNWEGDWQLKESFETHGIPSTGQVQSMADWLNARRAGINQARAELGAVPGVRVLYAVELNHVEHAARDISSVLRDVAPSVSSDYLSYSSWETISSTPTALLRRKTLDDIAFIKNFPAAAGRDLLITEFGFKESQHADSGDRTDIAARAFLDAALPLVFYWQIIDNECQNNQPNPPGTCPGLGLLRSNGTRAPAWTALADLLRPASSSPNAAAFLSQNIPLAVVAGSTFSATIRMRNTGTLSWDSADSYKLASRYPDDNTLWGSSRAALSSATTVSPGNDHSWVFTATAPVSTGTYNFSWRMIQEGVGAFGDLSPNISLFVVQPASWPMSGSGGSLSYQSPTGTAWVQIPASAFSEDVEVTLRSPSSFPAAAAPGGSMTGLGIGLEIVLNKALQPSREVLLMIPYRDADAAGLDERTLTAARYDETAGIWVRLNSTPDPANNRVIVRTNHFSVFQVMQSVAGSSVDAVKVFPNPLRPYRGQTEMNFNNLPAGSRVRIYALGGRLIRDLSADAAGRAIWDGKNASGTLVASGVYLVLAEGNGASKTFRVAVER